eukprot:scaffold230324_cov13-Prasinocladus_malaysianus.AAC.1
MLDAQTSGESLDIGDDQTLNLDVELESKTLAAKLANQDGPTIKFFLPVPGDLKTVAVHTKKVNGDNEVEVA